MSSLRALLGQPVIARDTADHLGIVDGVVIDPDVGTVVAVQLGANKACRFFGWDQINAVGADAVMVSSAHTREAQAPLEERAAAGIGSVLGKLLLDGGGDELGTIDDLEFDATTGAVELLRSGEQQIAGKRLLGIGSYAVVVSNDSGDT